MPKNFTSLIVVAVLVGSATFYAGLTYGKNQTNTNFQNMTPEQRQQFRQQGGGSGNGGFRGRNGMNGATGEIIAKDDTTLTIKLRDGGSKIVLYTPTTEISQFVKAESSDLAIGKNVFITGQPNADGSLTAQMIQIRPAMPPNPNPTNSNQDAPEKNKI